jgi:hypothetical protein
VFHKRITLEPAPIPLPRPAPASFAPQAFLVCPAAGLSPVQQWLYQKAFEEAQAVARPSILERDLLAVWN